ncbi:hypothetical protein Tco_0697445 [Tanacetum coccineum]
MPTGPSEHADSPSLDVKLALTDSEMDHVVHVWTKLENVDLRTTDAATQQKPEQMDESFTTTVLPNCLGQPQESQLRSALLIVLRGEATDEETRENNAKAEVQSDSHSEHQTATPQHNHNNNNSSTTTTLKHHRSDPHSSHSYWAIQAPLRFSLQGMCHRLKLVEPGLFKSTFSDSGEKHCKQKRMRRESPIELLRGLHLHTTSNPSSIGASGAPDSDDMIHQPKRLVAQEKSGGKNHYLKRKHSDSEHAWTFFFQTYKSDVVNNWASALATTYEPQLRTRCLQRLESEQTVMNCY